ncbi:MAG: flagellar biosynthesis regulator FlaF [Defluviimonas sp.]|uniref:flagellar biosynthesis regulator FlaF n=1 Tax=Albidovulum sp. TaxID=1872424 RepID=UPI002A2DA16A|nr:flagellar biosynthesis regulator FlaF [Defluviimonas sp.]
MNAHTLAQSAYGSAAATRTDRDTEYDALARITHRLHGLNAKSDFSSLVRALHDNRALWSIFATDVAERTNPLPADLKARIVYLARFTGLHTRRILAGEADTSALVEINTAVMRGLRHEAAA